MNLLKEQLIRSRFEHTLAYVRASANSLKKLTTSELAHLNQMVEGHTEEPWRMEPVSVNFAGGKKTEFSVASNPIIATRNILTYANEMIEEDNNLDAATFMYAQLVMGHFFKDGNRRTAVAAVYWLLQKKDLEIDANALLDEKLGDLREEGEIRKLKATIKKFIS
jgi:prophage maintenance system killer protein